MTYKRRNQGVCSQSTSVRLTCDNVIESVCVQGGCDGNLKGVCSLLCGRSANEAIELLSNIRCEGKDTSCPAEIAKCLNEALLAQCKSA